MLDGFVQIRVSSCKTKGSIMMIVTTAERVRVQKVEVLSDNWYILKKTTFDYLRNNGEWQTQSRETYDRGNGATILLYNLAQGTVILTRQFRYPVFVNGHHGLLIEAPAGLLDQHSPEARIKAETEEETGYRVDEKLYFFVAEYDPVSKVHRGGGVEAEGEDIEVLEVPFAEALAMVADGTITDGKTIMLLQYAQTAIFVR